MRPEEPPARIGQTYSALRYGGASRARACAELGVASRDGRRLEALFQVRPPGTGVDAMRPRYARDAQHVRAVIAAGGFPVLAR